MKTKDDVMGMNKDDKGMDDDTTTTSTKMTSDERKSLEMLVLPPLPSHDLLLPPTHSASPPTRHLTGNELS